MPIPERLKEFVRPYYLRWIYFPLIPRAKPEELRSCWSFPFERIAAGRRLPVSAADLPDLVFYPMTDWHQRNQRSRQLALAFGNLGFRCIYLSPHLGREF